MPNFGITPSVVFTVGPVEITGTLLSMWAVILVLAGVAAWVRLHLRRRPSGLQNAMEAFLGYLQQQVREIVGREPGPYLPLVATLFLFILASNLLGLLPLFLGVEPATADPTVTAALALVVFLAVPYYGIRARGARAYFGAYVKPFVFMLPLNIISELSRTLSLMVRLFGNIMSGGLLVAVLAYLGSMVLYGALNFVFEIPLKLLGIVTGLIQAYIFAVLTMVYIGGAVRKEKPAPAEESAEAKGGLS
jgi:F-type H+-transporting ATPase subunit a